MHTRFNSRSMFQYGLVLLLASLSFSSLAFINAFMPYSSSTLSGSTGPACSLTAKERQFSLDGIDLLVCLPFSPDVFVSASDTDLVQSAYIANRASGQELSLYAVPYGLQPAADNLPMAKANIASVYQALSFKAYVGEILADLNAQPVNLFGQTVLGRSVIIADKHGAGQQQITQWVVEAGDRVWLVRLTSSAKAFSASGSSPDPAQLVSLTSSNLARPSISVRLSQVVPPPVQVGGSSTMTDLAAPSWWSGDCDVKNFPGSFPLGSSYRGVKTCGPLGTMHLVNFGAGVSQYEWQCVEYVKRYLYLAFGVVPYMANGNTIVPNYTGTRLEKIIDGTPNKGPFAGDVISYTGPSTYGHTALVSASNIDGNGNGTITIAEQNYNKNGFRTQTVKNWHIISSDGVYGWLHDAQAENTPPAGYVKCADEGGLCKFSGTANVVFGARDSFTTPRVFKDEVDCNNAVFGDPLGGIGKACYFKTASAGTATNWTVKYFKGVEHWLDNNSQIGLMCEENLSASGLDKNYGTASPCGGAVVDDWVGDYSATVDFTPGEYVFQAQNDDGLKVWVNGQNIFDRGGSASLSSACPAINLSGSTPIRVILREETDQARVRLLWTTDTNVCTPPGSFGKLGPANNATGQPTTPTISWGFSRAVSTYSFCLDTTKNSACDTSWLDAGSTNSKPLSGLAYNTTYYWQVRSNNSGGEAYADGGTWWSFTTRSDPATCYSLTRSHTGSGDDPVATPANASGCASGSYRTGDNIAFHANPADGFKVGSWSGTNNDPSTSVENSLIMPARAGTVKVNYIQALPETPVTISPNGLVPDDLHPIYTWNRSAGATSYRLTVYNEDTTSFAISALVVSSSSCSSTTAICSVHPAVTLGNYNYAFKVAAVNSSGTSSFSPWRSFYIAKQTTTFVAVPSQDGYIRESAENSNIGGAFDVASIRFVVGDSALNQQYRAILSFNTDSLPDNAVILSAKLKITKQGGVGVDPMTTHSRLVVDIQRPFIGRTPALGLDDFRLGTGISSVAIVGKVPIGNIYSAAFLSAGLPNINTTGFTQLRLRYQVDDDNDNAADYLAFYSSNVTDSTTWPVLEVSFYVP